MQLTNIILREISSKLDQESMTSKNTTAYLKHGVDEQGYYQQKIVESEMGGSSEGEKNYVKIITKKRDIFSQLFEGGGGQVKALLIL
jgi:hypothetical protein